MRYGQRRYREKVGIQAMTKQRKLILKLLQFCAITVFLGCLIRPTQAAERNEYYTWLIEPKYKGAGPYSEGLWNVHDGTTGWGYVDSRDHVVLEFKYRRARSFRNGLAYALISSDKNTSRDLGVIDRTGNYVMEAHSGVELPVNYERTSGGIDLVAFQDVMTGKYGFLNLSGDVQIPAIYNQIRPFSEGLAAVKCGDFFGVIDVHGEWVIAPCYENLIGRFWKGYIPFRAETKLWGLLNTKGEIVLEPRYTNISESRDQSGPWVIDLNKKTRGVLGENLAVIVEPRYQVLSFLITSYYQGGIVFLQDDDSHSYKAFDTEGNELFKFPSFVAEPSKGGVDGYYVLQTFGRQDLFLVNKHGDMLLPPEFSDLYPHTEGIVSAKKNGLWGLLLLQKR